MITLFPLSHPISLIQNFIKFPPHYQSLKNPITKPKINYYLAKISYRTTYRKIPLITPKITSVKSKFTTSELSKISL
nr:MAG TPA: hypothetical protein [Caudoviricetes sp.]